MALAAQWKRISGIKAGTFNCRKTVFGTPSLHGEGRAIDCYADVKRPEQKTLAESYIAWLQANATELQVAVIIWNRRIWAWHRRGEGWRAYKGNPHTDHLHVEMSWEGAKNPSQLFNGQPGLGVLTPLVQKAKSLLGLEADEDESPGLDLSRLDEGPSWLEADYEVENEFLASQGWDEASDEPAARAVDGGEAKSGPELLGESTAEQAKAVIKAQVGRWGTDEDAVFAALRRLRPSQVAEISADGAIIDVLRDELSGPDLSGAGTLLARGRVGAMARAEVDRVVAAPARHSFGTLAAAMTRSVLLQHQDAFDRTGTGIIHGNTCPVPRPAGATAPRRTRGHRAANEPGRQPWPCTSCSRHWVMQHSRDSSSATSQALCSGPDRRTRR